MLCYRHKAFRTNFGVPTEDVAAVTTGDQACTSFDSIRCALGVVIPHKEASGLQTHSLGARSKSNRKTSFVPLRVQRTNNIAHQTRRTICYTVQLGPLYAADRKPTLFRIHNVPQTSKGAVDHERFFLFDRSQDVSAYDFVIVQQSLYACSSAAQASDLWIRKFNVCRRMQTVCGWPSRSSLGSSCRSKRERADAYSA